MVVQFVQKTVRAIFGSRNDRLIKGYLRRVERINGFEPKFRAMTDAQLRNTTAEFRKRTAAGERALDMIPECLAAARESMDRSIGIRNVFNPAYAEIFNPTSLPASVQPLYHATKAIMDATPPTESLGHHEPVPGWMQVEIPLEIYAAVRELYPVSRPPFRCRPFDVQLIGGMVLGEGKIAEMRTGEGKTIVAPLACYIACVESLKCHVVTVNDYLVQRDRDWVFPFYLHLGLTVGAIHPFHMQSTEDKQKAYHCDVLYGTNSELGFDYLRDNMKLSVEEQVQRKREFCIIDEVDSILIDEARTPLIISGPAHEDQPRYELADRIAQHLVKKQRDWDAGNAKVQQAVMRAKAIEGDKRTARDKAKIPALNEELKDLLAQIPKLEAQRDKFPKYYEVEREKKQAHLTHEGVAEAQKMADIGSFYVGASMDFPHLLENSLRAHVVYLRDKDYVVQPGQQGDQEVIIVDEFTGRLMIGRQWSDGLHQAVEAKERVKIKQETQTLATVTIQNFFKLYKRLAGMTGTAITEGTEFNEIYALDVVCIPTNLPIIRSDRDDLIYLSENDKWQAILDEIKRMHDVGRPVLVGTTSVESSETLSRLLEKKHGIAHEVLNAKQHDREALIVQHAGELGAVMIATNMAGRGTDIKLAPIPREALIRHWQQRNILSSEARPEMSDEQILKIADRHMARIQLGIKHQELETLSDADVRLRVLRMWVEQNTFTEQGQVEKMSAALCEKALDEAPNFLHHRLRLFTHVNEMGGLHIVGTERHEARRIDNQLRGRAGRQGDRGSSRFFISLEDDLMKLFAGNTTLKLLSMAGMKEGDAIEHRWISRSVEKAQRKVEQRNYEIRKQLLEYDEVMEHQRNNFYATRQSVLEGRAIRKLIFEYINDAVDDSVLTYIDKGYVASQVAEWVRQNLDVIIDAGKLHVDDLRDLQEQVREEARAEVNETIGVTLGEYMSHDQLPEDWDLRGLSAWAGTRFGVDLSVDRVKRMTIEEVKAELIEAVHQRIDQQDLAGLALFLEPLYAQKQLAEWVQQKFLIELKPDDLAPTRGERFDDLRNRVTNTIVQKAEEAYRLRERLYPIEYAMDMTFQTAQANGPMAAQALSGWANQRYDVNWSPETITQKPLQTLGEELVAESELWWTGGKLEALADKALAEHTQPQALADWALQRLGQQLDVPALTALDNAGRRAKIVEAGRALLRTELTQLERYVLLQILDTAWKDHLYAMDQLKDSVGLQGYAERDPRIVYKREGSLLFQQMQRSVRDRVTELIFRARLNSNVQVKSVYSKQTAEHADPGDLVKRAAANNAPDDAQQEQEDQGPTSRHARRAAAANEGQSDEESPKSQGPVYKERKKRK